MLHEYRDQITALKQENAHFAKIFFFFYELNQKIQNISEGREHATDIELSELKKKKLNLKDEALAMIKEYKEREK